MHEYVWDPETRGYLLSTHTDNFVANEVRPVFAGEMTNLGFAERIDFDANERLPLMWAQKNIYIADGKKVVEIEDTRYGKPISAEYAFEGRIRLQPVNLPRMIEKNAEIMDLLAVDAKRRIKEMYDEKKKGCDIVYIGFSGGKDSVVLLDLCHRVLPLTVPVLFNDTDMELPDTYRVWEKARERYPERDFLTSKADVPALENWKLFGPPARSIRWCCSVHKSAPALVTLKRLLGRDQITALAFLGVRKEESVARSKYAEDIAEGVKNASQDNAMPLLDWGAHEIYLYLFSNNLILHDAYRCGIPRIGCIMCPESADKYGWFVEAAYPTLMKPYIDVVTATSAKRFSSEEDVVDFIGSNDWQARKSGVALRKAFPKAVRHETVSTITWKSADLSEPLFQEWIKAVGTVERSLDSGYQYLRVPKSLGSGVRFCFPHEHMVEFDFGDEAAKLQLQARIQTVVQKASACIGCRSCEAECKFGAIGRKDGRIKINEENCVHCLKCFSGDLGCWRYLSMRLPEKTKSVLSSINAYKNFGLRGDWLPVLLDMGKDFFPWREDRHRLGNKMVESARAWLVQALLVDETEKAPAQLVELFRQRGALDPLGWDLIWIALANHSTLVKWFITAANIDRIYSIPELFDMLGDLAKSTKDGGLAALKDMLTKSPLGRDMAQSGQAVCSYQKKGASVTHLCRHAKEVDSLVCLYGLYVMAQAGNRSTFNVRSLLVADRESAYISPITAFGLSPDTFQAQCQGLQSKYPDFISCTFTHGLDEIKLYPQNKSCEDVVKLIQGV